MLVNVSGWGKAGWFNLGDSNCVSVFGGQWIYVCMDICIRIYVVQKGCWCLLIFQIFQKDLQKDLQNFTKSQISDFTKSAETTNKQ